MEHELEHIERRMYEDIHAAADETLRKRLKLGGYKIGSAFVSVAGALPPSAILMNLVHDLGLGESATRQQVDEVVACYLRAGVQRYFIQLHPQARPQELDRWLEDKGLEQTRGWMMFQREREKAPAVSTSLSVREARSGDADAFARICCNAFDLGDIAVPLIARLVMRPGWHCFMSFDGDTPAGIGAIYVEDDLAYFTFGATAPAFRGRGGQRAVLAARVAAALDLGCRVLVTCTGEDVAGDPQHSYRNILRTGFQERYVRRNYAPPKRG